MYLQTVSELVLIDENIKIPYSSPLYTINEAISFYYSQKILDWLEAKKNPSVSYFNHSEKKKSDEI